jgi:hypothetical protein
LRVDHHQETLTTGPEEPGYTSYRLRRFIVKVVALIVIVGMLLAFPLGYLLDAELRNHHVEAGLALIELTIAVVLVAVVRSSRRRL